MQQQKARNDLTCPCPLAISRPLCGAGHEATTECLTNSSVLSGAASQLGSAGSTDIHLVDIAFCIRLTNVIFAASDDINIINSKDKLEPLDKKKTKSIRCDGKRRQINISNAALRGLGAWEGTFVSQNGHVQVGSDCK
jgi:hypothetical protein